MSTSGGRPRPSVLGADGVFAGRVLGIPVYFAPSWFLVAGFITWAFAPEVASQIPGIGVARYVVSFLFAALLYLSVFVHELSHSVTARGLGLPVRRITLQLLGGVSEIEREPETPSREYLVAMAGPAVSLLIAGVGFAGAAALPDGTALRVLVGEVAFANALVAGFNLLPGLPLDGGRVLRAAVWGVTGRPYAGTFAAAWVGRALAVVLFVAPLLLSVLTRNAANLINVVYLALLASFIWAGASQSLAVARLQRRLPELTLARLARRALSVPADLPLAEALRRAQGAGARGLVVVDGNGRPDAVVSEAAVIAVPEGRRPWVEVGTLARRLDPDLVLSAELSGSAVLDALRRAPASEYLVVDRSGALYGVLASADVAAAVSG